MALLNTVASSAPDDGEREGQKHERRHAGLPRDGEPEAAQANDQQHRESRDPRLARETGIGDGAEDRREKRCNQLGAAGGIGPQRGAKRRIADEAVHEIGAEQEGDDERVEGLRRPVEQHPAGESERPGMFGRLAPDAALPLRGPACIEHDQMVGQLVLVDAARRKMLGENLAAGLDRGDEPLRALPSPEMRGEVFTTPFQVSCGTFL